VERWAWVIGFFLVVVGVAVSDYSGYQRLEEMRAEVRTLRGEVNEATRTVQEESAAVGAAMRRAEEAAAHAAIAVEGRKQAESNKQQAEAAAQQANQESRAAQDKMVQMQREREAELNQMQEALNRIVETRRTPNGMIISLPNSVFRFEFDSAELNPHNRELLSRIAGILLVSKGFGLSVFGYTDDVGTAEYNQQLSVRRANAVKDYLVQAGIAPGIINVKGYGKTSPSVESTTDEGRSKNRRVEIALTDSSIRFQ
jgi:outer membrane protein OmpA-like peptidoglycan-associated protein